MRTLFFLPLTYRSLACAYSPPLGVGPYSFLHIRPLAPYPEVSQPPLFHFRPLPPLLHIRPLLVGSLLRPHFRPPLPLFHLRPPVVGPSPFPHLRPLRPRPDPLLDPLLHLRRLAVGLLPPPLLLPPVL